MASPIKDTPVLSGDDAKKFLAEIQENTKSVPQSELDRMKSNYEIFKKLEIKSK